MSRDIINDANDSFYPVLNHTLSISKAIGLMFPKHLSMVLPISEKVFC